MPAIRITRTTKHLIKDTTVYGAGSLANRIIPVLLLPVLTRYLTPEEYGIVAIFAVSAAIVVNFVGFNLQAAIQRFYVDFSKQQLSDYVGTATLVISFSTAILLGLSIISKRPIADLLGISHSWIPAIIIVSFCQAIIAILEVIWRMERKARPFVIFQFLMTLANLVLSVVFVAGLLWHWQGRLLGILCSYGFFALLGLFILRAKGYLKFIFHKRNAKQMLWFSVPLIPQTLSTWIITGSDRLFVINMVGAYAVGLYSVGYAIGQVIQLLQHAFSQAWVPFLFQLLKKDEEKARIQIVKFIYFHHAVIIILAFSLHFAAPFILKALVGKSFQGASQFVIWIAMGYAVNGMYRMVFPFLNYAQKTHLAPIGSTIAAGGNLFLNYILIKLNGPIGAAQATFISFCILYIITFYLCNHAYKMPWLFWLPKKGKWTFCL